MIPIRLLQINGSSATNSLAVVLSNTPGDGNVEVATIAFEGGSNTSVSQAGVTWNKIVNISTSGARSEIWLGNNIANASTRINAVTNSGALVAIAAEYSVLNGSSDKIASDGGIGSTWDTGTTVATTIRQELWVAGAAVSVSSTFSSIVNNFILEQAITTSALGVTGAFFDKIVSAIGTANTSATIVSRRWAGTIATFYTKQQTNAYPASLSNFF